MGAGNAAMSPPDIRKFTERPKAENRRPLGFTYVHIDQCVSCPSRVPPGRFRGNRQ